MADNTFALSLLNTLMSRAQSAGTSFIENKEAELKRMIEERTKKSNLQTTGLEKALPYMVGDDKFQRQYESGFGLESGTIAGAKPKTAFEPDSPAGLNVATTLRKEFNDIVKDFRTVSQQYKNIKSAYDRAVAAGNTKTKAASDQALVVSFNKLIDPTSVVRESEYARTGEGQAAIAAIEGYIQKVRQGGSGLTDENRRDVVAMAHELVKSSQEFYKTQRQNYSGIARDYGVPENRIIGVDLSIPDLSVAPQSKQMGALNAETYDVLTATNPQTGEKVQSKDGGQTWQPIR